MNLATAKEYKPVSREHHYALMQAFIDSCKGLPQGKYKYKHYVSDNTYIRELFLKKGTLAVGAVHLKETALILVKGKVKIFSETGLHLLEGYNVTVTPPGTQRAALALEDSIIITINTIKDPCLENMIEELTDHDKLQLGGLNEGNYKLYIRGKKVIDENIQSSGDRLAVNRRIQWLIPNNH